MAKITKYTINNISDFYWCHIIPEGFSALLSSEHKIEFHFGNKNTSIIVKKENVAKVLGTYCGITEFLNQGSFCISEDTLMTLCSTEFKEVLNSINYLVLTHCFREYIELTPSIDYIRYNKYHTIMTLDGKMSDISKVCCCAYHPDCSRVIGNNNNHPKEIKPNWPNYWYTMLSDFIKMYFYYTISTSGNMNQGKIVLDGWHNPYRIINYCLEHNFVRLS